MIYAEQTALLRRELAFIKSDYRSIVVAYYIENKSTREIALSLSLPANTVKSRLLRARQILKEGIDMAREFGKLSYSPENIAFVMNGCLLSTSNEYKGNIRFCKFGNMEFRASFVISSGFFGQAENLFAYLPICGIALTAETLSSACGRCV